MNTVQYRAFLAVAETLSFSRAAEKLFMTQPAVSYQIKSLESDLGLRLVRRTQAKVALTEAGEALLPLVGALMEAEASLLAKASALKGRSRIAIGLPDIVLSLSVDYCADQINNISQAIPNCDIELTLVPDEIPLEKALSDGVDFVMRNLGDAPLPDGVESRVIHNNSTAYLAVSAEHPLAKRERVTDADLATVDLGFSKTMALYSSIIQQELSRGLSGAPDTAIPSFAVLLAYVQSGKLATIVPFPFDAPNVAFVPCDRPLSIPIGIAWKASDSDPLHAQARELFSETWGSKLAEEQEAAAGGAGARPGA